MINNCVTTQRSINRPMGVPVPDPYWANVVLSLRFDDGFVDSSPTGKIITNSGAALDQEQWKYGGKSALFVNATDKIILPTSADFTFDADFTVEAWIRPSVLEINGGLWSILDARPSGSNSGTYIIGLAATGGQYFPSMFVGGGVLRNALDSPVPINQDTYLTIQRKAGALEYFVNGVKSAYIYGLAGTMTANANPIIGSKDSNLSGFSARGNVDCLHITKGIARYSASFTPPTGPYVAP